MARAASFSDLPEGLVLRIFKHIPDVLERHGTLAPVCKAWSALLRRAELLEEVHSHEELADEGEYYGAVERLGWLAPIAAPHVRRLTLSTGPPSLEYMEFYSDELLPELLAAVRACGAAGQLQSLSLDVWAGLSLGSEDLAPLASLTELDVSVGTMWVEYQKYAEYGHIDYTLAVNGLKQLTALRRLRLAGAPVRLPPAAELPSSLTYLSLWLHRYADVHDSAPDYLPPQLSVLTGLLELRLVDAASSAASDYRALSALSKLERLDLVRCAHVPACLPALTSLRTLLLDADGTPYAGGGAALQLGAALGPLRQLSHLALRNVAAPPEGLARLTQPQRLCFVVDRWDPDAACAPLPPGPWLASLRQVALDVATAMASQPALAAATGLKALGVVCYGGQPKEAAAVAAAVKMLAAANTHLSLATLAVSFTRDVSEPQPRFAWQQFDAAVRGVPARPSLSLQRGSELIAELALARID